MIAKGETINWGLSAFNIPSRSRLQCGHLLVEFNRGENEVFLASKRLSEEEIISPMDHDTPVSWTNWAVCTGTEGVKILPGLPELAVVARQITPFSLAPGKEARLYLRIPISVQVRLNNPDEELLAEFPTERLERISFGEFPNTEECYLLRTPTQRTRFSQIDESEVQAPILIRNDSREMLNVSQICLRVSRLSVYDDGSMLWTNETLARYQGGPKPSRLSFKNAPPAEAPYAKRLIGPRDPNSSSIVGRTFRSFRRWAGEWN